MHQDPLFLHIGSHSNLSLKMVLEHGLTNHFPTDSSPYRRMGIFPFSSISSSSFLFLFLFLLSNNPTILEGSCLLISRSMVVLLNPYLDLWWCYYLLVFFIWRVWLLSSVISFMIQIWKFCCYHRSDLAETLSMNQSEVFIQIMKNRNKPLKSSNITFIEFFFKIMDRDAYAPRSLKYFLSSSSWIDVLILIVRSFTWFIIVTFIWV